MNKIILSVIMASLVCSCGLMKKTLGIEKESPDEMMVVARAPLSIPPEFGLRPLTTPDPSNDENPYFTQGERALLSQMK